jgi:3-phosphoshikimate 1-carboxyvinyltransferase
VTAAWLDLAAAHRARGQVRLPGSKSISNRVLLLAALARGETEIHDLLEADDVERMLDALRALGVAYSREPDGVWRIRGADGPFAVKHAELFLGNAGTAFRPLAAALALSGGSYRLTGTARMHERPIGDLVDAMRQLGARIRYLGREGYPPLYIEPAEIRPTETISIRGDVSSQFLTALLMALPLTGTGRAVEVRGELISKPYVEVTLGLMRRFGVAVRRSGWNHFAVPAAAAYLSPGTIHVEGDASSASYFLAAGALGGGPVRVTGVGRDAIQGDVRFAEALRRMGATVTMGDHWIESSAPRTGPLRAFDLDLNHIPDAAMTLAVAALFAEGTSTLRNIASWRVKETDRLRAMATELGKLGARVEEGADFLRVTPPQDRCLRAGVAIDTYDDHRMAMSFSLVCLAGVPVRINDPGCVSKTFPDFFAALATVLRRTA